jgi:hypothetical protein
VTSRLNDSFGREEMFRLGRITSDMEIQWARWSKALFHREQEGDLMRAAETLVALLEQPAPDNEAVEKTAAQVQEAIRAIKLHTAASARGTSRGN